MRTVLITGAGSYVGTGFESYAREHYPSELSVDTWDMLDGSWRGRDFADASGRPYDCVFHVAGIAHADVGRADEATKARYYSVNTDLAIEVATRARGAGVGQLVLMSSAIVYGDSAPYGRRKRITRDTEPAPTSFYGDSKWRADEGIRALATEDFKVAVLRCPMIYGRGSRGNYPTLAKMARRLPIFPDVDNERSVLYVENLCELVCQVVTRNLGGTFWPQNAEYARTSDLVRMVAGVHGHRIRVSRAWNWAVYLARAVPGRPRALADKAFGSLSYDQGMSQYDFDYRLVGLRESIERTEGMAATTARAESNSAAANAVASHKPHILLISQYFHPETFRVNDMAREWVRRGYKVTVLTGIPNYPMGRYFEGYDRTHRTRERWEGVDIIRLPLVARGNSANRLANACGMAANYLSFVWSGRRWVRSQEAADLGADLVFTVEVSPMTQALIGCWYARRHHVPSFLYVQDLWPENVEAVTGIHSRFVLGPMDRMVDKIYRETDTLFTTSPSFVEAIVKRAIPVPREKVHYWPQYAEEFYRPLPPQCVECIDPDDGKFKVAFTGNIGTAQGLDVIPKAAALLKEDNVRFVIVGDGRYQAELERQIDELGVRDMFTMIPRVPAERVPQILAACDAGFISFNDDPLWANTIPAKLQSYMACGKAIVASASGETERIVQEADCGVCCKLGDAEALAEGIRELMTVDSVVLGANARRYLEEHFDKQRLMDEMDSYLEPKLTHNRAIHPDRDAVHPYFEVGMA